MNESLNDDTGQKTWLREGLIKDFCQTYTATVTMFPLATPSVK